MKKCLVCGHDNLDEMGFCLQCGRPLADQPDTVGPSADPITESFSETPTVVRRGIAETQAFGQPISPPPPSGSNTKMLAILGGLAALVLLVIAGIGAVVGYNYFSRPKTNVANANSSPSSNGNRSTPASPSPGKSPAANTSPGTTPAPSPTPAVSFTPPTVPTKSGSFTIYGNAGWQLSNIDTVAQENFRTKVEGKVDIAGVKTGASPGGVNDAGSKSRRIYPEFPTGALLMRTRYADGNFSNVMAVAAGRSTGQWQNYKDEVGRLEFCINDNAPQQNGGHFMITVTMTSVPKAKK